MGARERADQSRGAAGVNDLKRSRVETERLGAARRGGTMGGGGEILKSLGKVLLVEGRLTGTAAAAFAMAPHVSPLNDPVVLDGMLEAIVGACGLTVLETTSRAFSPYGMTMVKVLSESHVSIHTWPECGAFALDVYSCRDSLNEWDVVDVVRQKLKEAGVGAGEANLDEGLTLRVKTVTRGLPPETPIRPRGGG